MKMMLYNWNVEYFYWQTIGFALRRLSKIGNFIRFFYATIRTSLFVVLVLLHRFFSICCANLRSFCWNLELFFIGFSGLLLSVFRGFIEENLFVSGRRPS